MVQTVVVFAMRAGSYCGNVLSVFWRGWLDKQYNRHQNTERYGSNDLGLDVLSTTQE